MNPEMSLPDNVQQPKEKLGPTGRFIEPTWLKSKSEVPTKPEAQQVREGHVKLKGLIDRMSVETNRRFESMGAKGMLCRDGRLDMNAFQKSGRNIQADDEFMGDIQWEHFRLDNEERHEELLSAFKQAHGRRGPRDRKEFLDFCSSTKENSLSNLCEMAITILLHRNFGDRYIVVRSATIDDLTEGSDGFIVDTLTGARVCSIDDFTVHKEALRGGTTENERHVEKIKKQRRRMERGGAHLKCGFEIKIDENRKKVVLGEAKNIPMFIAAIEKKDLLALVATLSADLQAPPSEIEKQLFATLLKSLQEQAAKFVDIVGNRVLKANIEKFQDALLSTQNRSVSGVN
jgi:hypothetical protein